MKIGTLSALCGFQELILLKDLQKRPFWGASGRRIGILHLSQSAIWDLGEHLPFPVSGEAGTGRWEPNKKGRVPPSGDHPMISSQVLCFSHPFLWSLFPRSLCGTLVDSGILDFSSMTQFSNLMVERHFITIWIVALSTGSLMSQNILNVGVWPWGPCVALTGKSSHIVLSQNHRA